MNCPSCARENRTDSRFCLGCGTPLASSCPGCGRELPPDAAFCDGCGHRLAAAPAEAPERSPRDYTPRHLADKILQSKSALEGERKQVTVLFADVKGSMDLAEQVDPEQWHAILDRFFQILSEGVHRFEGTVNQYTGDGIMALFGAPIAHEDHAQRACYAALHLREQLEAHARELKRERGLIFSVRMGINSGEVVVGKIGDDLRMDYTAQGHTVGLAQRMEQLAGPEKIYVAEATQRLAEGYVDLEDLGEFQVHGAHEPLHVFELRGRGSAHTRFDVSLARGLTRFVGRGNELRTLEEALERTLAGEAQIVALVADAGVGKSRLCYEFGERCRARGIPVRVGRGVAHGTSVPFLPIMEYLRDTVDIREGDSDQRARQKIAGSVVLLEDTLTDALPLLFDFMGVPDPERPPPPLEADVRQRQLFEIQRRLHRARSERNPVVLLFEDLHWFDPGSHQHLDHLVQAIQGTRTLLVANFRPEFQAPWMGKSFYQQIALRPLSSDEFAELLRELLGSDPSLDALFPLIIERTGGNPFYAEEVVRSLAESGKLEGARGAHRLVAPVDELAIPTSVRDLLAARIDRLPEMQKRLLQTAAVIGSEFPEPLVRQAEDISESDSTECLGPLVESELIYEEALYPEVVYAFRHPLIREVAYTSLLGTRRAELHRAVAQALEQTHVERLDESAALLAHHWESAGEPLLAARWASRAAERLARSSPQGSLEQWRKVRSLVEPIEDDAEAAHLEITACLGLLYAGRFFGSERGEATRVFEQGMERARTTGNTSALARMTASYAVLHAQWGDPESWHRVAEEAAKLVEEVADVEIRLEVLGAYALSLVVMRSAQRAIEVTEAELERAGDESSFAVGSSGHLEYVSLLRFRGFALGYLGRLDEAFAVLERALEIALDAGYASQVPNVLLSLATAASGRGDASSTLQYARRALEAAERIDSPALRIGSHLHIGRGHLIDEKFAIAIEELERAHGLALEHGVGLTRDSLVLIGLGEAHLGIGQLERARGPALPARAHLLEAQILLAEGELEAAPRIKTALDRAASGFEACRWDVFAPDVVLARARLAALRGDESAHLAQLREAHSLYTEMGATGHAERLAQELASRA